MSIIRATDLSVADMNLLGNNVGPARRGELSRRTQRRRAEISAVNRSLSQLGERVSRLHRPLLAIAR
jgi:hypothetical protein